MTGTSQSTTFRRIKDGSLRIRKYGRAVLIIGFAEPAE
jgi:hypothetical protein